MSYLCYLCWFAYSGVHVYCVVFFVLFVFVLCTQCWQFLWIVHSWFPLWFSLRFIHYSLSCVLCIQCWQFLWIVHSWFPLWFSPTYISIYYSFCSHILIYRMKICLWRNKKSCLALVIINSNIFCLIDFIFKMMENIDYCSLFLVFFFIFIYIIYWYCIYNIRPFSNGRYQVLLST